MLRRRMVVYMCQVLTTLFYIERNSVGPLMPFIAQDLSISIEEKGRVLGAFFAGYVTNQLPGAVLGQTFGGDIVLSISLAASGVTLLLIPFVKGSSSLCVCFAILGCCQGPMVSCCNTLLSRWIPPPERSEAVTLLMMGHTSGRLLSTVISGSLAATIGWRQVYFVYGCITAFVFVIWRRNVRSAPAACEENYLLAEEKEYLIANCPSPVDAEGQKQEGQQNYGCDHVQIEVQRVSTVLAKMLHSPSVWAIFQSHIFHNYCSYTLANWGPTYFTEVFGFSPRDSAFLATLPNVCGVLAQLTLKKTAISLQTHRGWSLLGVRRSFTCAAFIGSGMLFLTFSVAGTAFQAVACQCAIVMTMTLHGSGYNANYLDVGDENSGVLSGFGNTIANVPGFVGPPFTAWLLQHYGGSWVPVFYSVAFFNAVAAFFYYNFASARAAVQISKTAKQLAI